MPVGQEILLALRGAFLLARFDARGFAYFNVSLEGFWRSFLAAALVAPMTVVGLLTENNPAPIDWTSQVASYCIGWALFPLVMIPVARLLDLSASYVPYIIAYNWSQVVQASLFFALGVLHRTGLPMLAGTGPLDFAALVYVIVYAVFVARVALGIGSLMATGIAVLDIVVSYLVFFLLGQVL
jgi:hypothetical protein